MRYDFEAGRSLALREGIGTFSLLHAENLRRFHARNPFPIGGVYEDPATGAAAAPLAGYLRDLGWPHGGSIEIMQGEDMGVPSRLQLEITARTWRERACVGESSPDNYGAMMSRSVRRTGTLAQWVRRKRASRRREGIQVPGELIITAAKEADAAAVADIYAPYVRETAVSFEYEAPSAAIMSRRIAETIGTYPWLVASQDQEVIGYAYAGKHRDRLAYRWTVDVTVYVGLTTRRQGVGRTLYRALLDILRQQGFRSAFAEIVLPNPGSVRLHETAGFKLIGVHKNIGFKLGHWHDIGYWRSELAAVEAEPRDPVLFTVFRETPAFAISLQQARTTPSFP